MPRTQGKHSLVHWRLPLPCLLRCSWLCCQRNLVKATPQPPASTRSGHTHLPRRTWWISSVAMASVPSPFSPIYKSCFNRIRLVTLLYFPFSFHQGPMLHRYPWVAVGDWLQEHSRLSHKKAQFFPASILTPSYRLWVVSRSLTTLFAA